MIPNHETITKDDLINLLNLTDDKISYVDQDYTYRALNKAYVDTFKLPLEQIIGKKVWEIVGENVFDTIIKPKMDKAFQGETIVYESWFDFPTAKKAYLIVRYTPIKDSLGAIVGVAVTSSDITERKKLEDERAYYDKIMIDRARNAKLGDMLAMIAHEWRTPLHTLSTYLLRLNDNPSNKKEIFDRCEELIGNLSQTIENVNLFYQNKEIPETPLSDHIHHAISLLHYRIRKENVEIKLVLDPRCKYHNHGAILVHLFVIFIENSLDVLTLSLSDDKTVTIRTQCSPTTITIDIKDSGSGIDKSISQHIFDPGFSTKGTSENGYGLFIAKKIITESLKGEISLVRSKKGAHFRIVMPH